jgi:hypothetical protein
VEYRVNGVGSYVLGYTATPGATQTTLAGLAESTEYQWRVRHKKNGQYSSYSSGSNFTTGSTLSPPTNLVFDYPVGPYGRVTWTNSGDGASTEVYYGTVNPPTTLHSTVGPGSSSVFISGLTSGTWYARARHVKENSDPSAYTAVDSVVVP